jgi:copper chaperone CopZ
LTGSTNSSKISFSVASIECIACTPFFKRELRKLRGVKHVEPMVMMNTINVELDPKTTSADEVKKEILKIAAKGGFGGKVVFLRIASLESSSI